jgi:hypothetical protein
MQANRENPSVGNTRIRAPTVRSREKIAEIAGLTDESVCPTLLRQDLHSCGAGAFACQPIFSQLLREGLPAPDSKRLCHHPSRPRGYPGRGSDWVRPDPLLCRAPLTPLIVTVTFASTLRLWIPVP